MFLSPKLNRLTLTETWQEVEGDFGCDATTRWVAYFDLRIGDANKDRELRVNKDYDFGYIFGAVVCSEAFEKDPTEDYVNLPYKPIILEKFSEVEARSKIEETLSNIGEGDIDYVFEELRKYFDMEDVDAAEEASKKEPLMKNWFRW